MSEKKFCNQCGKELKENAKFCNHCGDPVPSEPMAEPEGNAKSNKKAQRLILIIIVIAIIVVVIIVSLLIVRSRSGTAFDTKNEIAATEADKAKANKDDVVPEETNEQETVEETDVTSSSASTPVEFMTYIYETYFIPEINEEGFWDECVADASKESGSPNRADYIQMVTDRVTQGGLTCLNYMAESFEDMGNDNYKVIGSLTYTLSSEEHTTDVTDYVTVEEGHYKVLPEALSKTELLVPSQISGVLNIISCEVEYTGDESITMTCTIENPSSSNVQLGWVASSQVELTLSDGKALYADLPTFSKINAGQTETFTVSFDNVSADIQKITIHSVNVLNSQGLPSDFSGGSDITAIFG